MLQSKGVDRYSCMKWKQQCMSLHLMVGKSNILMKTKISTLPSILTIRRKKHERRSLLEHDNYKSTRCKKPKISKTIIQTLFTLLNYIWPTADSPAKDVSYSKMYRPGKLLGCVPPPPGTSYGDRLFCQPQSSFRFCMAAWHRPEKSQ